ncbi:Leucine-rich repeat and WD repeat-containing 1 [Paramuricea clavata]|uniref:Leucine-rich repeat and WD repeat-containing 1 n=1 Tax=Paramuricea clavata TaxID=317549 RepID=A0A6S7FNA4_PARCT|nr:Leucine-rich repeat and WD repeat-containing 1 [Paramuricea clavata]
MGQTIGKSEIGELEICEITGCHSLEEIHQLSLSGLNLMSVNSDVLKRLRNLHSLDVSKNKLSGLKLEGFTLNSLKELNCSSNNLLSVDDFVLFPNLEKVDVSDNVSLEVADRYKLVSLLPKLKVLEDKDVSVMREAVKKFDGILAAKVAEHWNGHFEEAYRMSEDVSYRTDVANEFIQSLQTDVVIGPAALKKYREFKLTLLGQEHAVKRKHEKSAEQRPAKALKTSPAEVEETIFQSQNYKPQFKSKRVGVNYAQSEFVLSQLLQTHSLNNDPSDRRTQVWACEFQPDPLNPDKTTTLCATCGGDAVCFIECKTGEVSKKYKQPGDVFYCLAWTVFHVKTASGVEYRTALAVGGKQCDIRIIQPEDLVCYDSVEAHEGSIESLHFHPTEPTWLFSAGDDNQIVLSELGLSTAAKTNPKATILMKLRTQGILRSLTVPRHGEVLVGGGDKGCTVWSIIACANKKSHLPLYELNFPGKKKVPLDCVKCLSDHVIATKRVKEPCIMLYYSESSFQKNDASPAFRLPWKVTDTPFIKFNFRADCDILIAGDDLGRVWIYDVNRCLCESRQGKKLEELKETQKLICANGTVKTFNHVCSSTNMDYVVAVADSNVVCVWRRLKPA